MITRNLIISFIGALVISVSCFSAIALKIDTDQAFPLESNAPSMFIFTWTGDAGETWILEPLLITFKNSQTGNLWYDRLFPSIDQLPDMTRNWTLVHTIPIFIPAQPQTAEWTLSASTSKQEFSDLLRVKIASQSVFQAPFIPAFETSWEVFFEKPPVETIGFYEPEFSDQNNERWIWMSGDCRVVLPNPRLPVVFNLTGWIPNTVAQDLRVLINGHVLDTGDFVDDLLTLQKVIPLAWLEEAESLEIRMQTKETFTPANSGLSQDARELGMMIKNFHLYIETDTPYQRPLYDLLYDVEPQRPWFWASDNARLTFSETARDFRIFLQGWVPDHLFFPNNSLLIQINGAIIDTQALTSPYFRLLYHVPLQTIGVNPEMSFGICRVYPIKTLNMGVLLFPVSTIITNLWIN